jgi:hypothetical protein
MEVGFTVPGTHHVVLPSLVGIRVVGVDDWLADKFATRSWTGWYCYSDLPPDGKSYPYAGKCKGVVLWNDTEAAWLVHSVPEWPVEMPIESLPISKDQRVLAFWMGARDRLPKIESQIDLMGAKVYLGKRSLMYGLSGVATLQRIILDKQTDHVAKNKYWTRDIHESMGPNVEIHNGWVSTKKWIGIGGENGYLMCYDPSLVHFLNVNSPIPHRQDNPG